jgi:hypothetical protein
MKAVPKKAQAEVVALSPSGGALQPKTVVNWARNNPSSKLHALFEWDNRICGEKYRIIQAREIIQCVTITHPEFKQPIRFMVNLPEDRVHGSGYRRTEDILATPHGRRQLASMARDELQAWADRHEHIQDLCSRYKEVISILKNWKDEP